VTQAVIKQQAYTPVRTLNLYLTLACNLDCTYCFVQKRSTSMTSETARRAVDFFLDRNVSGALHSICINFFGGEPFLELDRMEEVVAYARRPRPNTYKKVTFSATTNGMFASPRAERVIRGARMSLLVSLDGGPHANASRPMVDGRSSYEVVARNLPRLVSWAKDVVVRVTFHPQSLDLVGAVRAMLDLGAPAVALAPVQEADWSRHEDALEAAYVELAEWYVTEARRGRILPVEITNMLLRQHHAHRTAGAPRPDRPCAVGASLLSVDPEGHVMPCHGYIHRPKDHLGTVEQPILSPERRHYTELASSHFLDCRGCVAEPICGGGCRVVVVASGRDLHGTHPAHCITMRAHARAVYRIYDTLRSERNTAFAAMLRGASRMSPTMQHLNAR